MKIFQRLIKLCILAPSLFILSLNSLILNIKLAQQLDDNDVLFPPTPQPKKSNPTEKYFC